MCKASALALGSLHQLTCLGGKWRSGHSNLNKPNTNSKALTCPVTGELKVKPGATGHDQVLSPPQSYPKPFPRTSEQLGFSLQNQKAH
jgi:hypothetical protein